MGISGGTSNALELTGALGKRKLPGKIFTRSSMIASWLHAVCPFPQTHLQDTNEFNIVTPAQRRREAKKARSRKMLRAAGFEQRARNMGITEKSLVAQKVAIWEGMWATKQNGDNIRVSIRYSSLFWRLW